MRKAEFFYNLLKSVFGTVIVQDSIDYDKNENKRNIIKYDGRLYYDNNYNGHYLERYETIFKYTFCTEDVIFVNDSNIKQEGEKEKIIQQTIRYFEWYGISFSEDLIRTVGYEPLCKVFLSAFCDIIFPLVFCNNDKYEEFDNKIELIKYKLEAMFAGFELGYIVHNHAKANELEFVYDSEYKLYIDFGMNEELYAVPIDTAKALCEIILHCPTSAVNIGVQRGSDNDNYTFESIIGNYQKYPLADDEPFMDPFIWQAENFVANSLKYTKESYFPLSHVMIPLQYFIPRYFYYVTRINEEIINRYKECYALDKIDHSELNNQLIKRAAKDFREVHRRDIAEYYYHVMMYIEDMIRRIATADYSFAIRRDSDVEACQKFTKHFNIDYEKIIKYIEDDDCVDKCYEKIESKIWDFALYLKMNTLRLAGELKEYQQCGIVSHYNNIGEYINSGKLLHAIKIKERILSKFTSNDTEKNLPTNIENGLLTMEKNFEILTPHENIYEQIYNVLKNYYDTLGRVIEDERQA